MIDQIRRRANTHNVPPVAQTSAPSDSRGKLKRTFNDFVALEPADYRNKLDALSKLRDCICYGQYAITELESFVQEVALEDLENLAETTSQCFMGDWDKREQFVESVCTVLANVVSIQTKQVPGKPKIYPIADELTKKIMCTSFPSLLLEMMKEVNVDITWDLGHAISVMLGNLCWVEQARMRLVSEDQAIQVVCGYANRNTTYSDSVIWLLNVLMTGANDYKPEWIEPLTETMPNLYQDLIGSPANAPQSAIACDLYALTTSFFKHPSQLDRGTFNVDVANKIAQSTFELDSEAWLAFARMCCLFTEDGAGNIHVLANSELMVTIEMRIQLTLVPKEAAAWFRFLHNFLIGMHENGFLIPNALFPNPLIKNCLMIALMEMQNYVWDEALFLWLMMISLSCTVEQIHDLFEYEADFNGVELIAQVLIYPSTALQLKAVSTLHHVLWVCENVNYQSGRPGSNFAKRLLVTGGTSLADRLDNLRQVSENKQLIDAIEPVYDTLERLAQHLDEFGEEENADGDFQIKAGYYGEEI